MKLRRGCLLALLLAVGGGSAGAEAPPLIRHNFARVPGETGPSFREEVLELVLEKSRPKYGDYRLQRVPNVPQSRAFRELEDGRLDIVGSMTNAEREAHALPVRYCVYKGLMGLRIGLGLPATVAALNDVRDMDALRQISLGLGFDWPDYAIQQAAGLQITRLANFENGVQRLKLGSFQLIPLGVVEAQPLARAHGLATISDWAIAYPSAYYFFVTPQRPRLAERLVHGFEQALRDKSFDALFARRIGPLLQAAQLDRRRIFYLPNPLLPPATPLARSELWHPIMQGQLKTR